MSKRQLKRFWVLLVTLIMIFCSVRIFAASDVMANDYQKIVSLPIGIGDGKIAYTPNIEDIEKRGPESFAVEANGNILILDTIDNQVEEFNKAGEPIKTYQLPDELKEFLDIETSGPDSFIVINYVGDVLEYKNGVILNKQKMDVKEEDHIAIGLFKDNDDNVLIRSRKSGFDFDIRTGKMKENMDGFKENLNGKNLELYSDLQKINIKYTYTPADTYPVFTTKQNEAIILKSEALLGNSVYVETKLEKYYNSIKMATALALPVNSNYDYKVPHKFVYYSKAGDAYQLVLKKDTADIYKLAFSTKDRTNIDVKLISEINPKDISTNEEVSIADVDGYTAYANTSPMINYSWTFNASTMKTPYIPNYTQSPDHLENLSGTSSQTGIPYCWGGAHGDVSACGWDSYSTALSKGKTAGNIRYENEEWVNSTAGVDCSGFISVAYRLGYKYNTTGLYYYFTVGTWNNLSSGCIFDKPGDHVVMYDYPYFSGSTIIGYYTRESTTSGSQDKAKLYSRSLSELSGYYVLHK